MTRGRIIGIMSVLFLLLLFVKGAEDDLSPNNAQEDPVIAEESLIDAPVTEDAKVEVEEPEPKPEPKPKPKVAEEPTQAQRPGVTKSQELTRRAKALLREIEPKMAESFNGGGEKVLGCLYRDRHYIVTTNDKEACIHNSSGAPKGMCLRMIRYRDPNPKPEDMNDSDLKVYNENLSTFVSVLEACKGARR